MKYRKKPVEVDAFRYGIDSTPKWFYKAMKQGKATCFGEMAQPGSFIEIHTLEGEMKANVGDYIIRGVVGELYPCKADIFWGTYEVVW